ncbi:hypothetical protein [Flavobacterium lipolyticum]|uniref:Uncharacterized protein n=1 Tax=Flavobacterium lipolyticum TaxID=2893754 RepID=A0ABS8M2Z7_9FLAO|nr:hypothetical protein [Flavobacterium sp. F-126]MCC9019167.1 hypothetical protein [Flavobacterium sp. F-126]
MNKYENYLIDLVSIQLEKLKELEYEISICKEEDKDYIKGQIMAYYDVLAIMKSQSDLFNILISLPAETDLERYLTLK